MQKGNFLSRFHEVKADKRARFNGFVSRCLPYRWDSRSNANTVVANRNHITGIFGLHNNTTPSNSVSSKALTQYTEKEVETF